MLDVGWSEMLVIAVVMIVVVGPKDLPKMLRTFGRFSAKLRGMAGDFQKQFNEALREAELDDVKKSVDSLRSLNPANEIRKQINPFEKAASDIRAGLDSALKPTPKPASTDVHTAAPLKNGATAMPGVEGPPTVPEPPVLTPAAPPPVTPAELAPAPAAVPPGAVNGSGQDEPAAKAAGQRASKAAPKAAAAKPTARPKTAARKPGAVT